MISKFDSIYTSEKSKNAIPIICITPEKWKSNLSTKLKDKWLEATGFEAKKSEYRLIPGQNGKIKEIVVGFDELDPYCLSDLSKILPEGDYYFQSRLPKDILWHMSLGWGLSNYQFKNKKSELSGRARLVIPSQISSQKLKAFLDSIFWIRDLINMPSTDLTPEKLAENAKEMAQSFGAESKIYVGKELIEQNYPLIYAVGKGSVHKPTFTMIEWGNKEHPKLSLIGKGVTFDTGGVNIKPDSAMRLMKKDMGGAAHALGLGRLIMALDLPIHLQILIPSAENAVSGNAYKPLDVLNSRKGLTIEIGHTDAEGRLVLADALFESAQHNPELVIDFATLTGAIRVALGPELPGFFTNNSNIGEEIMRIGEKMHDPLWQMPLFKPYRKWILGRNADLCNVASGSLSSEIPHAGAITAALFLQEFIPQNADWVHVDFSAWNYGSKPAHPEGGEAMALQSLFAYLEKRFKK